MDESKRDPRKDIHLNYLHVIDILGLCKAASTANNDAQGMQLLKSAAQTVSSILSDECDAQIEFPGKPDLERLVDWRLENRAAVLEAKGTVDNVKKALVKVEAELSKSSDEGDLMDQDFALTDIHNGLREMHGFVSKKGKLTELQRKRAAAEMDDDFEEFLLRYAVVDDVKRRRVSQD